MRSSAVGILLLAASSHAYAVTPRAGRLTMGLFDAFSKAFENKDYSNSPATYEQTNARASHILVNTEEECQSIKSQIESGELDFAGAAVKYSTCNSAAKGGKLGKFNPGTMVPEFDEVVFGLYDTGEISPRNEAALYKEKYELDEIHGPVKSVRLPPHQDRDALHCRVHFRLKEEGVVEP